jgi:translation initiation factor IF-3
LSRPFPSRNPPSAGAFVRVNGKIRAREVRVIGVDGKQLGVLSLGDALTMARSHGVDLVEIAPNATPPVCRLVDFGKYRYEQAKRDKESRKHQHATKVKEVQLSPKIDPHDLGVKVGHTIDFLCEDMKVKVTLKFRGREMAHTDIGFQIVEKFLTEIAPYGHPDFEPKLNGRAINLMISPLPRNKRAKHPSQPDGTPAPTSAAVPPAAHAPAHHAPAHHAPAPSQPREEPRPRPIPVHADHRSEVEESKSNAGFANNPFAQLEIKH